MIKIGVCFIADNKLLNHLVDDQFEFISFSIEDEELPKGLNFLLTDSEKVLEMMYEGELSFDNYPKVLAFCINSFVRLTWMKFLSINGIATFTDFELTEHEAKRLVLLFKDQSSVHLNDYLQDRDQPLLDFKISNWGNAGYIFDLICLHAASNAVDVKALRIYLELMMIYFLTIKKEGEEVLPIEMQVSSKDNTFYLLLSFHAKEDFFHDFFKNVYASNQNEIVKNWLYYLPVLVSSLEVNFTKSLEKVSFVSTWNSEDNFDLGSEGNVIFNVIQNHRPWLEVEGSTSQEELDEDSLIDMLEAKIEKLDPYQKTNLPDKNLFPANENSEFFKDRTLLKNVTEHCHEELIKISGGDSSKPIDKQVVKGILSKHENPIIVSGLKDEDLDLLVTRLNNFDETKGLEDKLTIIKSQKNTQAEVDDVVRIKSQANFIDEIVQRIPGENLNEAEAITRVKGIKEKMDEVIRISGGNSESDQFAKTFVKNMGESLKTEKNWNVAIGPALNDAIGESDILKVSRTNGSAEKQEEAVQVISAGTGLESDQVRMIVKNLSQQAKSIEDEAWLVKAQESKNSDSNKEDLKVMKSLLESISSGEALNPAQMKMFENMLKNQTSMLEEAEAERKKYIKLKHMLVVEGNTIEQKLKHSENEIKQKDFQLQTLRTNILNINNNKDREILSLQNQVDFLQANRGGTNESLDKKEQPQDASMKQDLLNQVLKAKQERERINVELIKTRSQEQAMRQEIKALKKYKEAFELKSKEDADKFILENKTRQTHSPNGELGSTDLDDRNLISKMKHDMGMMNVELKKFRVTEQNLKQEIKALKRMKEITDEQSRDNLHEQAKESEKNHNKDLKNQDLANQERVLNQQRYIDLKKELLAAQGEIRMKDALLKKAQVSEGLPGEIQGQTASIADKTVAISKYNQLEVSHKNITNDFKKSITELSANKKELMGLKTQRIVLENKVKQLEKEIDKLKSNEKKGAA